MSNPFSDFGNLTLDPGGAYQQQTKYAQQAPTGGASPGGAPAGAAFAQQPAPPMVATDDAWGLVAGYESASTPRTANAPPLAAPNAAVARQFFPTAAAPAAAPPPPPPPPASPHDSGLPAGWTAYQDRGSGRMYYSHVGGQVTWDRPAQQLAPQLLAAPYAASPGRGALVPTAAAGGGNPFSAFGDATPTTSADPFATAPPPKGVRLNSYSAHSIVSDSVGSATSGDASGPSAGAGGGGGGNDDDFWATMGFGVEELVPIKDPAEKGEHDDDDSDDNRSQTSIRDSLVNIPCQIEAHKADDGAGRLEAGGLPNGETYDAKLDRPGVRLGAVFQTATQCRDTVYCKVADEVIDALGTRPVVAYMSGDGAAHRAGIHVGEILLKVGDVDVVDPKLARELIKTMKRPLTLTILKPDLPVIVGENQHMVKYNNNKPRAPTHLAQWKAKYCVVGNVMGGIAAKPYTMLMYTSKGDYDRYVACNLANRPPDVKFRICDLRGCSLIEDQTVHYPGNSFVWHFFIIQPPPSATEPGTGLPANNIKISHPNPEGLVPVLEAVRRVLKKYPERPAPAYHHHHQERQRPAEYGGYPPQGDGYGGQPQAGYGGQQEWSVSAPRRSRRASS